MSARGYVRDSGSAAVREGNGEGSDDGCVLGRLAVLDGSCCRHGVVAGLASSVCREQLGESVMHSIAQSLHVLALTPMPWFGDVQAHSRSRLSPVASKSPTTAGTGCTRRLGCVALRRSGERSGLLLMEHHREQDVEHPSSSVGVSSGMEHRCVHQHHDSWNQVRPVVTSVSGLGWCVGCR